MATTVTDRISVVLDHLGIERATSQHLCWPMLRNSPKGIRDVLHRSRLFVRRVSIVAFVISVSGYNSCR